MHAVLRAIPLAVGSMIALASLRAQTVELPPIFVPRTSPAPATTAVTSARRTSPVSGRVRSLINAASHRVLDEATVFDAPAASSEVYVGSTSGTMMMTPVIVRGEPLQESQVRVPRLELFRFVPEGGDKYRRIAGGATAPLYQTFIGNKELLVELSILNAAGKGIDHNIDFTRAELAFRFKW